MGKAYHQIRRLNEELLAFATRSSRVTRTVTVPRRGFAPCPDRSTRGDDGRPAAPRASPHRVSHLLRSDQEDQQKTGRHRATAFRVRSTGHPC